MSYQIDYQPVTKLHRLHQCRTRRAALTGLFAGLFLLLVGTGWDAGRSVLRGILFSGDWSVTVEAAEALVHRLGSGENMQEAITVFCREILEGSGVGIG